MSTEIMPTNKKSRRSKGKKSLVDKACFAFYKCSNCSNTWKPSNSWPDIIQECKTCNSEVIPAMEPETQHLNNKKGVGQYHCCKCSNSWMPSIAWPDIIQECMQCNTSNIPIMKDARYNGKNKCFGKYKCENCSKSWMSANSWKGYGQQCNKCKMNVLPYMQRALDYPDGIKPDDKKPHLCSLCEKCRSLKHNCTKIPRWNKTRRQKTTSVFIM